ncbi:hypothetical protein CGRA01v4_06842 [Colletotrichum graminicola]|uniref:Uncharacterized protein n=1 Tax=Colletotrichum graminicola (strain M1.001 / M2 / FGSC 10212) TaxID=645133 RepID=E3Q2S3_COLGM|nr:uncharacterized protein GLRG_00046 [Colletotrichum graminicola M1.001]EFQ24902.1 hypothetical protein GLRG_00046 [Colletotrichum graminicola M1.001]WDK15561.1 hypothetical protein CGRA01v4_06842 [Colletotrichum graminicola]
MSSISGIFLLGTTQRGSSSAGLAHIVAAIAAAVHQAYRFPILSTLSEDSQLLEDTVRNFTIQAHRLQFNIHSFYEEGETNIAQLAHSSLRRFISPASKTTLVRRDSACLQGYNGTALTLDHFHLNKFSDPEDANYILVRHVLEGIMIKASDRCQMDSFLQSWVSDALDAWVTNVSLEHSAQTPAAIPFKAFTIKDMAFERTVYYRNQGFGAWCTLEQARDTASALFSVEEQHTFDLCSSLVPSYEDGSASQTVLMRTDCPPAFLACLEIDLGASLWIDTSRGRLCFDRHFKGFTQLYENPHDKAITADIVAIPELYRYACSSWRAEESTHGIWIQDFFQKDLSQFRLLIYGYIPNFAVEGIESVNKYCDELLERLHCVRQSPEETHRPLILVGHRIGCFLASQLLLKAAGCQEPGTMTGSLADSITGMIFFAVPRRADIVDEIQDMLKDGADCPSHHVVEMVNGALDALRDNLCDFEVYLGDGEFLRLEPSRPKETLRGTLTPWSKLVELFDLGSPMITTPVLCVEKTPGDRSTVAELETISSPAYKRILKFLRSHEKDLVSRRKLEWFEAAGVRQLGITVLHDPIPP